MYKFRYIRILIVLLLIVSIFDIEIPVKFGKNEVVVLIDDSFSMKGYEYEIETYLEDIFSKYNEKDILIASFSGELNVKKDFKEKNDFTIGDLSFSMDESNIIGSIDSAKKLFSRESLKKIYLISDGLDTVNSVEDFEMPEDIDFIVENISGKNINDVQLVDLNYEKIDEDKILIEIEIFSTINKKCKILISNDDERILDISEDVKIGQNKFRYVIRLEKNPSYFKGEVICNGDENSNNNQFIIPYKENYKKEIIVVCHKKEIETLEKIFSSYGRNITFRDPSEMPIDKNYIDKFDGIVLSNISYDDLPESFFKIIKENVFLKGTGLFVIGGEKSFAFGDYEGTVLEEILPVDSNMKGKNKKGDTGLVILLDTSGSMFDESDGYRKDDMGKEAVLRATSILEEDDHLGLIGFSDHTNWIIPFGQIKDDDSYDKKIKTISSKGGTIILPSLIEARKALENVDLANKHIVIISDGNGDMDGFNEEINILKSKNITLSTLAIGNDSNEEFLKKLSLLGGGNYYSTNNFSQIPNIIAKEIYKAKKNYFQEGEFNLNVVLEKEFLEEKKIPSITGYIGVGIKENGQVVIETTDKDPILSFWNFGIGKVIVLNSNITNGWMANWFLESKNLSTISNIISWISLEKNEDMKFEIISDKNMVKVKSKDEEDKTMKNLRIISPSNKVTNSNEVLANEVGKYRIQQFDENHNLIGEDFFYKNYSYEHDLKTSSPLWEEEFMETSKNIPYRSIVLNKILIPIGLILFIISIAIRKFH